MAEEGESLIVNNSPIEFVIIGPRGEHDAVLVRTNDAKLDLIGFGSSGETLYRPRQGLPVVAGTGNDMACIKSTTLPPAYSSEKRMLQFSLCVRANITKVDYEKLNKMFEERVIDVRAAIVDWDPIKLERAIAPLIFHCYKEHMANTRIRKARQWIMMSAYVFYGVMMIATVWIMFSWVFERLYFHR